jgi:hypothetical protein
MVGNGFTYAVREQATQGILTASSGGGGGGFEYLRRSSVSRKRRQRRGNPVLRV